MPLEYSPTSGTPFIFSQRLTDTTSRTRSGGISNKEYIVRVYYFPNVERSQWVVIAFNGRIGGNLRMQYKGYSNRASFAVNMAVGEIDNKRYSWSSDYVRHEGENFERSDLPGVLVPNVTTGLLHEEDNLRNVINSQLERSDAETPLIPVNPPTRRRRGRPRGSRNRIRAPQETQETVETVEEIEARQQLRQRQIEEWNIREERDAREALILRNLTELWADLDYNKILENPEYTSATIKIIKEDLDFTEGSEVARAEDFIYEGFKRPEIQQKLLQEIPKEIFDKLRMTENNRKIVEEHFNPVTEEIKEDDDYNNLMDSLFAKNKGWYKKSNQEIMDEIKGYFKYVAMGPNGEKDIYNIFWKGYGNNVQILKTDMPVELFEEHYYPIESRARREAEKTYKEVMESYLYDR